LSAKTSTQTQQLQICVSLRVKFRLQLSLIIFGTSSSTTSSTKPHTKVRLMFKESCSRRFESNWIWLGEPSPGSCRQRTGSEPKPRRPLKRRKIFARRSKPGPLADLLVISKHCSLSCQECSAKLRPQNCITFRFHQRTLTRRWQCSTTLGKTLH